jgi:hypothetical protein
MVAFVRWGMAGIVLIGLGSGVLGCKWVMGTSNDEAAGSASASTTAAPAQTAPPPTTVAADPVPGASSAPSAVAAGSAPDSPNPADAPAPPAVRDPVVNKPQPGIEPCCNALAAYEHSGRPKGVRNKAARAAGICRGISETIRSGRSTRAQGLAQVRSLMSGNAPPECS